MVFGSRNLSIWRLDFALICIESKMWPLAKKLTKKPINTSQEINKTSQETNKISQETNQKPYNTGHKMNQDEIPATELTNTDKIRNAIADNPSVTQKELQELTGLSRSGVRYILQQMRAAGKLDRIGSTKNGKWILKE